MPIEVPDREVWNHRLGYRRRIHTAKFGDLGYLGGVRLTLIIGTEGNVISANVTEGPKEFYAEAMEFAQAWKYKPFLRGGRPIVAQIQDTIAILPLERLPSTHIPFPTVEDWKSAGHYARTYRVLRDLPELQGRNSRRRDRAVYRQRFRCRVGKA